MNSSNRKPAKKQKITHYFVVDSNERDNQQVEVSQEESGSVAVSVSDRPRPSEQDYEESDVADDNVANQNSDLPKSESEKTKKRKFVIAWLTKYPWLKYSEGRMYCSLCVAQKKHNAFTEAGGTDNFRTSTLTR